MVNRRRYIITGPKDLTAVLKIVAKAAASSGSTHLTLVIDY